MDKITESESKQFEELYIALQILILVILLNVAIPLLAETTFTPLVLYCILFTFYLGIKIYIFAKTAYFSEENSLLIKNKFLSLIDGIFVGVFIYLQLKKGNGLFDFLYVYVIVQSIRYHTSKAVLFCIATPIIHTLILLVYNKEDFFKSDIIMSTVLYFVIYIVIKVALNQINELKEERSYYFNEVARKNSELQALVSKDFLTDLNNHQSFYSYYDEVVSYAYKKQHNLGLTLIDIDNFKKINDTYGHLAGDQILKELGVILKTSIRNTDFAARYGGEEFAVIFPNTDIHSTIKLSERIRKKVENYDFIVDSKKINVTISLGSDTFIPTTLQPSQYTFIKKVDSLLYQAKKSGKNQVAYTRSSY